MKYRKLPVVIDAVLWDGDAHTANTFIGDGYTTDWEYVSAESSDLIISTLEGEMRASVGDWIIKGVAGEFYTAKPDIFAATYEALDAEEAQGG